MNHRVAILSLLLAALLSRAEHPLIYESPVRFADEAAEVAFAGNADEKSASPESEVRSQQVVVDRSTLIRTLVDFPQDFLDGLVAEERNGYVSYPISVRIDPASGCALFENAAGRVFYAIAPVSGDPATTDIPAGNVVVKWRVLPEDFNMGTPRLRTSDSGLRTLAPDTLRLSSIACSTNGVTIGAAWPASDAPTNGVLDLYFSTHLDCDWRLLKTMAIPAGATNLATFLATDDIPSYTNLPPAHVHDADCHIVTNISPNIFSGGAVVTNIHWSCAGQRTPPYEGDSGFFRLGTRDDTDGDGLPDAYEAIVSGTNPLLDDTDGDGLRDDGELDAGTDPLNPDTDGDGLSDGDEVGFARPRQSSLYFWTFQNRLSTNLLAGITSATNDMVWTIPLADPIIVDSNRYDRITIDLNGLVHLHQCGTSNMYSSVHVPLDFPAWTPSQEGGQDISIADLNGCHLVADPANAASLRRVTADVFNSEILLFENLMPVGGSATEGLLTFLLFIPHNDDSFFGRDITVTFLSVPDSFLAAAPSLGIQNRLFRSHSDPEIFANHTDILDPDRRDASGHVSYILRAGTGTNPLVADTDGDGVPDAVEITELHTSPVNQDTDEDGLGDGEEMQAGTDPLLPDSDGDGLPDGWEVEFGLDPLDDEDAQTDTDGDGIANLEEYVNGTNPADASDWRTAEWYVMTADAGTGVPVSQAWTTAIPAGQSSLVVVFSHSEEFPDYTCDESRYNDMLEWLVSAQGHPDLRGLIHVNDRHEIWTDCHQNGISIGSFSPVCVEDTAFFTAPADEALSLRISLGGGNIADGQFPSSLIVGVFPFELAQGNMPTPTGIDGSTDGGEYHRALISDHGIAYVTGEPSAPDLDAQIKGLPWFFDLTWTFSITAERNGRGQVDNRTVPQQGHYFAAGDDIMSITDALNHEIVGGRSEFNVDVDTAFSFSANLRANQSRPFSIRGKNPLDATARAYIDANVDAEFQPFAWAIARHESWAPRNSRAYNQFNPNATEGFFEQPNKTVPVPPRTTAWGFGMAQIDKGEDGLQTDIAWDWHANILEMNSILRRKLQDHNRFIQFYRDAYGTLSTWTDPPSQYTLNGATLSAAQWGAITLYNGAGGIPKQSTPAHSSFFSPWSFNAATSEWVLHQNTNHYSMRIARELNGSTGTCEE